MSKIYAYHIEPIYPRKPGDPVGFATACIMECMVSGKVLSGSGGGGYFLSPLAYRELAERRGNHYFLHGVDEPGQPYAYRISPMYEANADTGEGEMMSCCMMECMVSGVTLSTSGGGGDYLSPAVFDELRQAYRDRNS